MNYMKQVAQMLGVELNEEFNISSNEGTKYRFTELGGLEYFHEPIGKWMVSPTYFYKILNGTYEIMKIPKTILDEVEKRYLSNVIKPFRNKVINICKHGWCEHECEYISINYRNINGYTNTICFPYFEKGTMYKGMEIGKRYSLSELEL